MWCYGYRDSELNDSGSIDDDYNDNFKVNYTGSRDNANSIILTGNRARINPDKNGLKFYDEIIKEEINMIINVLFPLDLRGENIIIGIKKEMVK